MDPRLRSACAAVRELAMLPLERVEHPLVTLVRDASKPDVWDANHACHVRAKTADEIAEVFAFVERERPENLGHWDFRCDPETSPEFVAALFHRGFEATATIQMRLDGAIARQTPAVALREVETASDWTELAVIAEANRRDDVQDGAPRLSEAVVRGLGDLKHASVPPVRFWIAEVEGAPAGYTGGWSGPDGIGIVEWVAVAPAFRRRGIASALVRHASEAVQAEGAGTVLIGPLEGPDDGPRRCYEALGFCPWFATQRFLRASPGPA